jgi:uncharacterized protein DUF6980
MKHCCTQMLYALEDGRVQIQYSPRTRCYMIPLLYKGKWDGGYSCIDYCPWCGKKLPEYLGQKFNEIFKQEYGVDFEYEMLTNKEFPEEFKTDEWWKKRGL